MTIEMTSRRGPFEGRPVWVELSVTLILLAILFLIFLALGVASTALLPSAAIGAVVGSYSVWRRRHQAPNVKKVFVADHLADRVKAKVADGADNANIKAAVHLMQSEGLKRTEAEMVVTHFLREVNPQNFGHLNRFFETRQICDETNHF